MEHTYLQAGNSRVLLGSTLGHILFNISSTNSLEEMMDNISIKFAAAPRCLQVVGIEGTRLFTAMKSVRMSDIQPSKRGSEWMQGKTSSLWAWLPEEGVLALYSEFPDMLSPEHPTWPQC